MIVHTAHFCGLSSNPAFLEWLGGFDAAMRDELMEHARSGPSCGQNTQKMMSLLQRMAARDGGEAALEAFLRERLPHALVDFHGSGGGNAVFDHYDPALLTFPRRMVLHDEATFLAFVADKPVHDHVKTGGVYYVEYLPEELRRFEHSIPKSNWQVRAWKQKHGRGEA